MPISERSKKVLRDLGLTEYETEAYLTVLQQGETTAAQTSRDSKIPYSRVYEVLKRLEDKGWIQLKTGKPQRYIPLPPKDTVKSLRMDFLRQFADSEKEIIQTLQPIYEQRGGSERSDVVILHGQNSLITKLLGMIDQTSQYAFIALPPLSDILWDMITPTAQILKQRKVQVRLLLTVKPSRNILKMLDFFEMRVQSGLYASGMIIDQKETLLALPEPQYTTGNEENTKKIGSRKSPLEQLQWAIWSDHEGLAIIATDYFDHIWIKAHPINM